MQANSQFRRVQTPRIKICGLRDTATILAMDQLPLTEIGLMFAPSKRQVTVEEAKDLVRAIHTINNGATKAVGVFVRYPIADMNRLLQEIPLDVVQLHGNEEVGYYEQLKESFPAVELWKVISIDANLEINEELARKLDIEISLYRPYIGALLIDAPGGGTGKPFNWEAISVYRELSNQYQLPLYVAGGLHANNVQQLLHAHDCDGVDVSSGVETDGKKDLNKINEFVRKVIEA